MSALAIPSLDGVRVLVTGGAGFVGSHLVAALVARGARVRVLDDLSAGSRENLRSSAERIDLVAGDIRDRELCLQACEGVLYVFHQAALGSVPRSLVDPATTLAVNVQGTANVLTAAREAAVRRVVYASSSSVYGDSERLPKREGEEGEPLSPYALSKQICERLARTFERCYGLPSLGLRYFNVYGPRQDPRGPYAAVIPRFFVARLSGRKPVIFGDGEQSRDFTFVDDAVHANLLALGAEHADGRAVNVASGRQTTILDLDRLVAELAGGGPPAAHGAARPGDTRHSLADLEAAAELLQYAPRTDLATGLRRCLDHYQSCKVTAPSALP